MKEPFRAGVLPRVRWVVAFSIFLVALTALPVLAAEPPTPDLGAVALPDSSTEAQGEWAPDPETVRDGLRQAEDEEAKRARELETPAFASERERSREAFAELDATAAKALLESVFAEQLRELNLDPARYMSRAEVVRPLGGTAVTVVENGDRSLLDAGVPIKAPEEGAMEPVDLALEPTAEGFETENATNEVAIGDAAGDPIEIGDEGLAIAAQGVSPSPTHRYGEQNVFQFETSADTDTLISPTASGVEIFNLLRSARSPESFDFEIDVPAGASLEPYGGSGAAVVKDGKPIAVVPPPTAVDAQGTEVPVNLVVESNSIRLETGHRNGDYAYPILLDPILEDYLWYHGDPDGLSNGAWQWASNPYGLIYFGTSCFYACWGPGLYLTAPARNYGAQTYSHWAYSAPNSASYLENVNLNPFWRHEHGCSSSVYAEPHDYVGYVDNNSNWIGSPVNNGSKGGAYLLWGWGRAFIVGASSGPGVNIPCWRDFYVGVAGIWLDDWAAPSISAPWGYPTDWINGSEQFTVGVNSSDAGLGVQRVKLLPSGKPIADEDTVGGCTGVYASRCPNNRTSNLKLIGSSVGEGVRNITVSAIDPTGEATATAPFQTKVDYSKPVVTLEGQLAEVTDADEGEAKGDENVEKLRLPVYNLKINATDVGTETDPDLKKRSGVENIEVWLETEGQPNKKKSVPWSPTPSCAASCARVETFPLNLSDLETVGTHRLEVRVKDFAGNEKVRDIEFEYFPATGMKDEYVMHYFPLPDGQGEEQSEAPTLRPELAVNVMNGNLVYRQTDVDLQSTAAVDLEVERYYNSMLPEAENTEWGDGWTMAETPDLDPNGSGPALATAATMVQDPGGANRYFSLWLDMQTPAGAREGYELRFKVVTTNTFKVTLSKWVAGVETELESVPGLYLGDGSSVALVDEGSTVSAWANTGTGFTEFLNADDAAFDDGRTGMHGAGNVTRLSNFKAGKLDDALSVAADLAALPVSEVFDGGSASNARFASEWTALGWAEGSTPKGATTTIGWRPSNAYETINGAFYNKVLDGSSAAPEEAELLDSSGVVEPEVELPVLEGQEKFDPELQTTLTMRPSGGYLMTDETGASDTSVVFNQAGKTEALVTKGEARVDYDYKSGDIAEISVEDLGTFSTEDPSEFEIAEPEPTNGTPLFHSALGSLGAGEGQFSKPADVAIDTNGDLWVADQENNRVKHLNPAGEFIAAFGTKGTGNGQLNRPASVAVDAEGNLWVADTYNYRVQKFDSDGEYLDQFGSQGSGNGQLNRPEGVAIDEDGDVWVSDTYNYRVQKFDSDGEFVEVVNPEGLGAIEPTGIDAGPDDKIWVADWTHNRIAVLSGDGNFVLSFGSVGSGNGQFNHPDAIEVDDAGNVWVGDEGNQRIQRFNQSGTFVDKFGGPGAGNGQFSFNYPFGFAVGDDHRIWVADRNNNRVQRWDPPYTSPQVSIAKDDDPTVEVETDGGLVDELSGEEAGELDYAHSGDLLTSVDGPAGETKYTYDGDGRLTKVTLPNGTYGQVTYFADGRVESVKVAPGGTNAKTTYFAYTDSPTRRTVVDPPDTPNITYDIGADGSVLKWWNTAKPPELNVNGSLYAKREQDGALLAGDHELTVEAEDEEGIASVQILINSNVVAEMSCEQVGGPPVECTKPEPLPWVTATENHPPGYLDVEVVAIDSNGERASERFWVDIPEPPPPPAPGTPKAPRFGEILNFREAYGLEKVFPVASKIERNEMIFNLINAWHEPNTPAGAVARASWERWGVPLRPQDVAELEHREWLYDVNGERIDQWVEAMSPSTYAGYYVDHAAGGIMRIGFTSNQETSLIALSSTLSLVGGEAGAAGPRLQVYPTIPTVSYLEVKATSLSLGAEIESNPTLSGLISNVEEDEAGRTVRVGSQNVAQTESLIDQIFGVNAPITVNYEAPNGDVMSGRYRNSGRMRAGDAIFTVRYTASYPEQPLGPYSCTAGFGAKDKAGEINGKTTWRLWVLTAGHCSGLNSVYEKIYRRSSDSNLLDKDDWRKFGEVKRDAFHRFEYATTDAEAIRVEESGIIPEDIYGWNGGSIPVEPAGKVRLRNTVCFSGIRHDDPSCGRVVARSTRWIYGGDGFARGGYWVKFDEPALKGDSGGPVWRAGTRRSIGLISASRNDGTETLVEPLLHPPNLAAKYVVGILHNEYMQPLSLKLGNGG